MAVIFSQVPFIEKNRLSCGRTAGSIPALSRPALDALATDAIAGGSAAMQAVAANASDKATASAAGRKRFKADSGGNRGTGRRDPPSSVQRGTRARPRRDAYQSRMRSAGAFHILSPGLVPKASWKPSLLMAAPSARNCAGECGSITTSCSVRSSRTLARQTCEKP